MGPLGHMVVSDDLGTFALMSSGRIEAGGVRTAVFCGIAKMRTIRKHA